MIRHKIGLVSVLAGFVVAGCAQQPAPAPAPAPPPLATKPTVGQEVGAVAQNQVEVRFASGSDQLSAEANQQLDLATRLFRDVNPVKMYAMGYSDANGDEFGNIVLSARRARAVKQGLIARGIPADRVLIQAFGESDPVNRADPQAAANRRVVIQWQIL